MSHRPVLYEALSTGEYHFARVCRETPRKKINGQTTLIVQGEAHDWVYWLRAGWVYRYRFLPDGRRQILDVYLPGDLMGIDCMFTREQQHVIETLTQCSCYALDVESFWGALERPETALWVSWAMTHERQRIDAHATWLGRYSAEERIAAFFLELYERLRRLQIVNGRSFLCPLTQRHLADCLGITIVHTNRVLKRLQASHIVGMQYRTVIIHDLERLRVLAYPSIAGLGAGAAKIAPSLEPAQSR